MVTVLMAAGVAVLLAGVVLALLYPRVALLLLVTLDVSNINAVIAEQLGASPYVPQLLLALFALAVMVRRRLFRFSWSPVLLGLLVLFAGFCLSFLAAADPVTSASVLLGLCRDLVYFLVVYALLLSTRQTRSVVIAAVLVLAALAGLTVFHEFVLNNAGTLGGLSRVPLVQEGGALTPRHAGTSSDVNFWARLLILFAPLSLSLFAAARRAGSRLLWAGCTLALLLGIYLTQSRGGFIAIFIALVVWAALAGGRYRKTLLWVPLGLAVLVPLTGIGSRLATLAAVGSSTTANADSSVVTRERVQIDAWHMFLDAPITGHGIGSYGTLFPAYDRLSDFYSSVVPVIAPHNFYLEQAAGGGILLLLAWAVFLGAVVFAALRTLAIARSTGNALNRHLAVGVVGGIVGWLVASIFLHLSDFRALLLMAAVAAALDVQSRRELRQLPPRALPPEGARGRAASRGLAAVSALGLIALAVVVASGSDRYSSSATLAVLPASSQADGGVAYQLDVISRQRIVPTLAEVLQQSMSVADLEQQAGRSYASSDARLGVSQSRLGGAVVVTVTAGNAAAAGELASAAASVAQSRVSALASGYRLSGVADVPVLISPYRLGAAVPLALIVLLSAFGAFRLRPRPAVPAATPAPPPVAAGRMSR